MTPAQTFRQFTQELDHWWPPAGRRAGAPRAYIEPHVGGHWYERDAKGEFDPTLSTEVEVAIKPLSSAASLVSLQHRHLEGLGAAAAGGLHHA